MFFEAYRRSFELLVVVSRKAYHLTNLPIASDTPLPEMIRGGLRHAPPGLLPAALAVELALFSAYLKGERPISLLIIAPVGSGKTELLEAYSENRGVALYNDFTSYGLTSLLSQIQAGIVKHVLVSDLLRLVARGPSVWTQILTTLNSLMEEGVRNIDTFFVRFHSPTPVRAGVIAALTTEEWKRRRDSWIRYGFLSRAVPISFMLAPEDVLRGEEAVYEGKQVFQKVRLEFPDSQAEVEVPEPQKGKLMRLGRILAAVNGDETRFRSQRHVLGMAKASALRAGRNRVEDEDVELLRALSILWLSPYTGDEPSFWIMLELPKTPGQLVEALAPRYSRATVYRRIQRLKELGAVKEEDGMLHPNL